MDDKKLKILAGCLLAAVIVVAIVNVKVSMDLEKKEAEIESMETVLSEVESTTPTVIELDPVEESKVYTTDTDAELEEEEKDLSYLVTSTQYTLGYGVRAREGPGEGYDIYKVIYDIYQPVDVISEDQWYKCLIDNHICYINWRYIGDEEDVEYVKEKKKAEEERKKSAYYSVFENMTDEEYNLLAWILALEAGDEPFKGKLAVIEVICNRVISKNPAWPDTISGVIYQKGQFATVKYLSHPYNSPKDSDYEAIEYVRNHGATAIREFLDEAGMTNINSLDYVFFATYKANGTDFVKYGGHYFSREKSSKYHHTPN